MSTPTAPGISSSPADLVGLFPGRKVTVETSGAPLEVTVYALPFNDLRRYADLVTECATEIGRAVALLGERPTRQTVIGLSVPVVTKHLMPLVASCVDGLDILHPRLPHYVVPPLIDAWLEESFGSEKKIKPWADLVDQVVRRVGGESPGIWAILSSYFSSRGTASPTSTPGGLTSSDSGSAEPATS